MQGTSAQLGDKLASRLLHVGNCVRVAFDQASRREVTHPIPRRWIYRRARGPASVPYTIRVRKVGRSTCLVAVESQWRRRQNANLNLARSSSSTSMVECTVDCLQPDATYVGPAQPESRERMVDASAISTQFSCCHAPSCAHSRQRRRPVRNRFLIAFPFCYSPPLVYIAKKKAQKNLAGQHEAVAVAT
jgi:hypothetical protein